MTEPGVSAAGHAPAPVYRAGTGPALAVSLAARTTWARAVGAANGPRGASGALLCFQRLPTAKTGGATPDFDILDAAQDPPQEPPVPPREAAAGPPGRTARRGLPFMSRNEARTAAAPAASTSFPGRGGGGCPPPAAGRLTCLRAGPDGSGEKRGDPKQPRQEPTPLVPPAKSGPVRGG